MSCPGKVLIGSNLVFGICTHDANTGELTDADTAPTYRIYEDETAAAILTGSMAKLDDDNTTGFYTELIACTTGNGFSNRKTYTIYIEFTVDGNTGGICYAFKTNVKFIYISEMDIQSLLGCEMDSQHLLGSELDSTHLLAMEIDAKDS